ncbi:MAG: hypothetical protein QOC77_3560 [Thermoleophilaceae bacterium]|nr:hypothetical protein [Thermoleophilaceae bacterium]
MPSGYVDAMGDVDDVPQLVRAWDERLQRDTSRFDLLAPEAIATGTLLREPATESEIADAERRLRVSLPPAYRAFLLTSNGAWASSLGPETQHWGRTNRHGFVRAGEIAPLSEVDPFLIQIWTEPDIFRDPDRDRPPRDDEITEVEYYEPIRHALVISRPFDAFKDLLVPRAASEEWEVWQFAKEGAGAHRSFAAFLRWQLARPDRRPKPELADQYAEEVRQGTPHRLNDLAELGDPRTGELALAHLLDPHVTEFFKRGWVQPLVKLADPAFVPDLRRLYEQATLGDFRMDLLEALDRCGDPEIEETLEAVTNDPADPAARFARLLLEQHRDAS